MQRTMDTLLEKTENFAVTKEDVMGMVAEINVRGFTEENADDFMQKMIEMKYLAKVYKVKMIDLIVILKDNVAGPAN